MFATINQSKRWTPDEDRDVMRMRPTEFQLIHGRTLQAIKSRREYINNGQLTKSSGWGLIVKPVEPPSMDVLAERDRRLALQPRDTTAALLGDPLPGYSALDQRPIS